jgi:hypothetical protein
MNKTIKTIAVAGALIGTLALTGCVREGREGYNDKGWSSENVGTPAGTVTCVLFDGYDGDTIECDWEGMKR